MAYADSAIDYTWSIDKFIPSSGLMVVKYVADSAHDSNTRPDQYQRFNLTSSQYDSATILSLIDTRASAVVAAWNQGLTNEDAADSVGISAAGITSLSGSDRYKPTVYGTPNVPFTDYNPLLYKDSFGTVETADAITRTYNVVARDSDEKVDARSLVNITVESLLKSLVSNSAAMDALGFQSSTGGHIVAHTSFDASAAGSFDYSTDKFDDFNVDSVSRLGAGEFKVTFTEPMPNAKFTAVTGVGDQDYGGVGASPRQITVAARDSNSVTIICDRTDDAVNEDNAYISVAVLGSYGGDSETASFGEFTVRNLGYITNPSPLYYKADPGVTRVQTVLGYNDSDMAQWLVDNGARWDQFTQ